MNRPEQDKHRTSTASASIAPRSASQRFRVAGPAWLQPRARDFGIGYGNSSGYASDRHYAENWGQERFRMG